jgi:hypothetical protein
VSFDKPFHRNSRPVKKGHNSGYSDWAYIVDHHYSDHPEHYTRAFAIQQKDIIGLFEYIEPSDINSVTYSFRIHELLIRTCIEIEANFKAILKENIFNPVIKNGPKKGQPRDEKSWNINDFKIVNKTHHLDDYSIIFPHWHGMNNERFPFRQWKKDEQLTWYQAYNKCKHDRLHKFEQASLGNLLDAFSGLCVLLSSQFRTESFNTGSDSLAVNTDSYYGGEFGIGGFLIVDFPSDWKDEEYYEFDWAELKKEKDRFRKIDYNSFL